MANHTEKQPVHRAEPLTSVRGREKGKKRNFLKVTFHLLAQDFSYNKNGGGHLPNATLPLSGGDHLVTLWAKRDDARENAKAKGMWCGLLGCAGRKQTDNHTRTHKGEKGGGRKLETQKSSMWVA